ncbi:MAG: DUF1295 domain-containing protein [Vicinamibacterales bacterium]
MDTLRLLHLLLLFLLSASVAMAALWAGQRRTGNAAVVDVGWTFGVALCALAAAIAGDGWVGRRVAVAVMSGLWGLRLGLYLLRDRVRRRGEDPRYARLRHAWGRAADTRFFWFFQAQALAVALFAVPALLASANPRQTHAPLELAALAIWFVAFAGELTADRQLESFKSNRANAGRTCRVGLWRYSRHPNYFFEWLIWVATALFASASPLGWLAFACPLLMLYLLFRVTGIPAAEAQAVQSRGDDYRRYQETTSAFVPWFPRSADRRETA